MSQKLTPEALEARRTRILESARWCFLNFGFARTSLEDVARRAGISRTLLYRSFKDKEDLFIQVFDDWLMARLPQALIAARQAGSPQARLMAVCRIVLLELWAEKEAAPMAAEFQDVCETLRPQVAQRHWDGVRQCFNEVLQDPEQAIVFQLALGGLLVDRPSIDVLTVRVTRLVACFTERSREDS